MPYSISPPSLNTSSAQPQVYRTIIDDVIANIQVDFEEYGMEEEILTNLQAKWEAKLLDTRVADFARAPGSPSSDGEASGSKNIGSSPPTGSMQQLPYGVSFPAPGNGLALPGQQGLSLNGQGGRGQGTGYDEMRVKAEPEDPLRLRGGAGDDEDTKPYIKPEPNAAGLLPGDEVIDSDLDDSDDELRDEGEEEADGEIDIVFCVYDKVQRVKNKWKTVFKDGMIHINGRDYLFAKCTGEFEW